jgi:hypothetical protein
MREITSHKVNVCNEALQIRTFDEPNETGACHHYRICVPMLNPAERYPEENSKRARTYCDLNFQNGPVANENDVNGITHEALLAVVIDRLQGFQAGPYACRENALALTKLEEAAHWLHHRTRARTARGVEGTHQK